VDDGIPDSWSEPVGPTRVRVSPRAGGPGTVVTVTADIQGSCDSGYPFFQDHKQLGTDNATLLRDSGSYDLKANRVVARYTITSKDAVGWGRFAMSCDMRLDTYRVGYAKFRVPTNRIWTKANRPLLRLITCAGSYDHATRHYRDNLIVYASPTGS
jgi:hypothetical protein